MATLQEVSFYIKKFSNSFSISSGSGQQTIYSSPNASNFLFAVFIPRMTQSSSNGGTLQNIYGVNSALPNAAYVHFSLNIIFNTPAFSPPVINSSTYALGRQDATYLGYSNCPIMLANEDLVTTHSGGGGYSMQYEIIQYFGRL